MDIARFKKQIDFILEIDKEKKHFQTDAYLRGIPLRK